MAQKLKKEPKKPKLPKKPKANASKEVKERWVSRVKDIAKKYKSKVAEVKKHNAKLKTDKVASEGLSKKISGITAANAFK